MPGDIIWAPAIDGAFVLTTRGGDFDLQLGTDVSIGYTSHDAETVQLYLQETLTFLCWKVVRAYQTEQTPDNEVAVRQFLTLDATRWQYLTGVPDETLVDPASWYHDYALISRPGNDKVQLKLLRDYATNAPLYPRVHEYFRASGVPLLAVWGRGDEIFGPAGAEAFADDLPAAEIHLLDGGHFLLESALDEVAELIRNFLAKVHVPA